MELKLGEVVDSKGRRITVTPVAHEVLPALREHLVGVARRGGTITYGAVKRDLGLSYAANGMGRLLDLLSEDCFRRDEPSLAALVVSAATGEVGSDFEGDAAAERQDVYARWSAS